MPVLKLGETGRRNPDLPSHLVKMQASLDAGQPKLQPWMGQPLISRHI
jgi:hypothetical protein